VKLALLILFAAVAVYFGWRFIRLRRGVVQLERLLDRDPPPSSVDIPSMVYQSALRPLTRKSLDAISEANLARDSEMRQRFFLETLLNEIMDGIIILDRNQDIRFVNEAARNLFPSDQPYRGRQLLAVCRNHKIVETVELAEEIGQKVSERITRDIEDDLTGRLREISLLVEAEPFTRTGGRHTQGSWILLRDITKELETEQIRRDFVANASHELRTPLSIISGYLETLNSEGVELDSTTSRKFLTTMQEHAERISRIVDDMLTISKLENADDLLNRETFDLIQPIESMIDHLRPLIEENGAKVSIDDGGSPEWPFVGDRYYWDQIFFNLIENALKQNPNPGLKVKVRLRSENGRYEISVIDNGAGIPASDLPLIFKRFYRVEKHHAKTIKGTGLGLSIVKRAVEAHYGSITVDSHPGRKTIFQISVPAPSDAAIASFFTNRDDDESPSGPVDDPES